MRRLFQTLYSTPTPYEAQCAPRALSRRMSSDNRRILKLPRLESHRHRQVAGIFQIPVRQCTMKSHLLYQSRICNSIGHVPTKILMICDAAHVGTLCNPRLCRRDLLPFFFRPFDFRTGRRCSLFLYIRERNGVTKFRDSLCVNRRSGSISPCVLRFR